MVRWFGAALGLAGVALLPAPAFAKCQVAKIAEIPVTITQGRAIATVQINGRDARFIVDSGAFFTTISQATATDYGLPVRKTGRKMGGFGGEVSLGVTTAKAFGISGHALKNVDLFVGGSDVGFAGILGQNFLDFQDVEYDLPHGMIRLMQKEDCKNMDLAYWAGSRPFVTLDTEPPAIAGQGTIGHVSVNGTRLLTMFDSGAHGLMVTRAAARLFGVTPDSPGVTPDGLGGGIGVKSAQSWRARVDSVDIGGEAIKRPWIRIIDDSIGALEAWVGFDFFLTHRIYVDNQAHRMFFTYEGGPVFGLDHGGAVDDKGAAIGMAGAEPHDAAGYMVRGATFATAGKYAPAIADFDKALAIEPGNAHYLLERARAHRANKQSELAAADLDKAVGIAPGDADVRLARATLRIEAHDSAGALADLKAADQALTPSSDARLRLASAYTETGDYGAAIASIDLWFKGHPEDRGRADGFNSRCWARALGNRELDKALDDCDAGLHLSPNDPGILDSRALVRFRRGEFDRAIADYDAVLKAQPKNAWSLYARAIVERRMGKTADADKDRAAALAIDPKVAERAKRYKLEE